MSFYNHIHVYFCIIFTNDSPLSMILHCPVHCKTSLAKQKNKISDICYFLRGKSTVYMMLLFLLFNKLDTDPCDPNPCGDSTGVHGTCRKLTTSVPKCDCHHRYIGEYCTGKSIILIRAATALVCLAPVASLKTLTSALTLPKSTDF